MLTRPKYTKIFTIAVYLFIAATAIFLLANFALAANLDVGLEYAAGTGLSNAVDIRIIIARVIRIALGFLGIIAVGLVMYAGWLWMTSQGNEEKIEQAKKILQNAVIGLIIILLSFAIVSFILNMLVGATSGGQGGQAGEPPANYGLGALGNGIIESHYPARDQKEAPRNTSIIITFRELMKADTLCINPVSQGSGKPDKCTGGDPQTGNINKNIIRIFKKSQETICVTGTSPSSSCDSLVAYVRVYSTDDGKTFVFVPINYLGSPSEYINYTVYLGKGLLRQSGEKAFPGISGDYGWSFEVSNKIDLTPPQVKPSGVFPLPDNLQDTRVPGIGRQATGSITVNDKRDQPMNTAIQVNFNEAVMPLTVSGTADDVKDFIKVVNAKDNPVAKGGVCAIDADCESFVCDNKICTGDNKYLKGKFAVSNQYQTVEFLSEKECGFNNCGEKIYCLPANSHLRVELNAANLISCEKDGIADNSLCADKSPFNTCDPTRKFCRDNVNVNSYYPQAAKTYANIVNGLVDAAFNSLDGNRDGWAYGPASFYNENLPENNNTEKLAKAAGGDSYKWSFFISNILDLTPPKIKTTSPIINGSGINLIDKIMISFDKLMLSSRLTTGSLMIQNGRESIQHYLLNLRSFVDQPLGYWVTNAGQQSVPGSGEINQTDVYINHSPFSKSSTYKAQAGSGLKDIYQNCYLPCAGPACSGAANQVDSQKPCCCNGAPYTTCP